MGGAICFAHYARRHGRVALLRGLVSTASLLALTVPGMVLAQGTPAPAATANAPPTDSAPPVIADPTLIDRDKVPSNTESLTADDFSRTYSPAVTGALLQRGPGTATSDE